MAFALDSFVVSFSLAGVYDASRTKEVEFIPTGADIAAQRAQLDTDIDAWLTAFNNDNARDAGVSTAFVTGYTVSEKWFEQTNIPAFSADDNIFVEAYPSASIEGRVGVAGTGIPAPSASIFVNDSFNSGQIDKEDTALEAFLALYSDGGGNNALSDGEQLQNPVNVQKARIRTVKTGRNL